MTKFEQWFIRRVIRKEVQQTVGIRHERITELYKMIRVEAERKFYEDNTVSLNSFLTELFENSLRKPTQ